MTLIPFGFTVRVHDLLAMPEEEEEENGERRKPYAPGFQLDSPVFSLSWTTMEAVRVCAGRFDPLS